jgi:hypothetical protein
LTTLAQASLTLQTARLHPPRFTPGLSTARTGASLPGTRASPRTGLSPAGPPLACRSVTSCWTLSLMAPELLGAPREGSQPPAQLRRRSNAPTSSARSAALSRDQFQSSSNSARSDEEKWTPSSTIHPLRAKREQFSPHPTWNLRLPPAHRPPALAGPPLPRTKLRVWSVSVLHRMRRFLARGKTLPGIGDYLRRFTACSRRPDHRPADSQASLSCPPWRDATAARSCDVCGARAARPRQPRRSQS